MIFKIKRSFVKNDKNFNFYYKTGGWTEYVLRKTAIFDIYQNNGNLKVIFAQHKMQNQALEYSQFLRDFRNDQRLKKQINENDSKPNEFSGMFFFQNNKTSQLKNENVDIVTKKLKSLNKKQFVWDAIISFEPEELEKANFFSPESIAAFVNSKLKIFLKRSGFAENGMEIFSAIHINTTNPHIHTLFYETQKNFISKKDKPTFKGIPHFNKHKMLEFRNDVIESLKEKSDYDKVYSLKMDIWNDKRDYQSLIKENLNFDLLKSIFKIQSHMSLANNLIKGKNAKFDDVSLFVQKEVLSIKKQIIENNQEVQNFRNNWLTKLNEIKELDLSDKPKTKAIRDKFLKEDGESSVEKRINNQILKFCLNTNIKNPDKKNEFNLLNSSLNNGIFKNLKRLPLNIYLFELNKQKAHNFFNASKKEKNESPSPTLELLSTT